MDIIGFCHSYEKNSDQYIFFKMTLSVVDFYFIYLLGGGIVGGIYRLISLAL